MEMLAGWAIVIGIGLFYKLTTPKERDGWMWSAITFCAVAFAIGLIWDAFH